MHELKIKAASRTNGIAVRQVTVYINSSFLLLSGNWDWELSADAVFCSDVMFGLQLQFEGTIGLIHPDDLAALKELFSQPLTIPQSIAFRIITTYGEVRTLSGYDLLIEKKETDAPGLEASLLQAAQAQIHEKKEKDHLLILKEVYEKSERFAGTGVWYYNTATMDTWYSPHVFSIYDLPPNSLNANMNTFTGFIHPQDQEAVKEFMDRSYKTRTPLHIEYRIRTAIAEKTVLHMTNWFFNAAGELIISGTLQDITQQKRREQSIEEAARNIEFLRKQLVYDEEHARLGHWQLSLLTRKMSFSDNLYRIFGLKPGSLAPSFNSIMDFIHMDDRNAVAEAHRKIFHEHALPDLDYRILTPDGKLRYLTQKAKINSIDGEMIICATIQDVTAQKILEKKLEDILETEGIKQAAQGQSEEIAGVATWTWELDSGRSSWSENFSRLLGYKSSSVELSQKQLLLFVHPDDRKTFNGALTRALVQKEESTFQFRLIQRGSVRFMEAFFRVLNRKENEVFIGTFRDISRERQLEQKLQEQKQFSTILSENAPDCIFITDLNNTITEWNGQSESAFGFKKQDASGKNFFDVFPQLKTEEVLRLFRQVMKGEEVILDAHRSKMLKGYHNVHMIPIIKDGEMDVIGILHMLRDVTQEVELRRNLNERLHFIGSVLEASVDRIIALDRNMNYVYWNRKAEEYYGLAKEQVLGKNILEVFPAFLNDPTYNDFRQALRGQLVQTSYTPDPLGKREFFETYLIPVKNETDEVSGVLWMVRDLTERVEAERKIKEQTELLQSVFDTAFTGIAVVRNVYNENYEIIDFEFAFANPAAMNILGSDPSGKTLLTLFPHAKEFGLFDNLCAVAETGQRVEKEFYYGHDGLNHWFFVVLMKVDEGVSCTFEDITQRKKAEAETQKNLDILRQAEQTAIMGSWEYNAATKAFTWSEGMYRLFGIENGVVVGPEVYLDHACENDKWIAREIVSKIRSFQPIEYTVTLSNNRVLKVKSSVAYNADGQPEKMIGVDVDISDLKQAENEVLASRNILYQTTLATPDAITVYDLENQQPIYLNNCLAEWTGYSNDELVNMGVKGRLKLLHEEDRPAILEFNKQIRSAADGEIRMMEYRLVTKKGTRWLRNRSKIFKRREDGTPTHLLSVLQDLTEEVALRQQLAARTGPRSPL